MFTKTMYKYQNDIGMVISEFKPDVEYATMTRLIASEGCVLTSDFKQFFTTIDCESDMQYLYVELLESESKPVAEVESEQDEILDVLLLAVDELYTLSSEETTVQPLTLLTVRQRIIDLILKRALRE